jgi:hypothetical protein
MPRSTSARKGERFRSASLRGNVSQARNTGCAAPSHSARYMSTEHGWEAVGTSGICEALATTSQPADGARGLPLHGDALHFGRQRCCGFVAAHEHFYCIIVPRRRQGDADLQDVGAIPEGRGATGG